MTNNNLYSICKRVNNAKRNYLLVNNKQAKHIPVNPIETYDMMNRLVELYNVGESKKVLVIGFAETATALGAIFAEIVSNTYRELKVVYMTTTREKIKAKDRIEFTENHSHAVEQSLLSNNWTEIIKDTDEIIFVEDEISTGNTINNIVTELRKQGKIKEDLKITVASILNGMSKEKIAEFKSNGIEFIWVESIDNSKFTSIVNNRSYKENNIKDKTKVGMKILEDIKYKYDKLLISNNFRCGISINTYIKELQTGFDKWYNELILDDNILNIDVIGTEECMYPAIKLAKNIVDKANREGRRLNVTTHSTTRSPIHAENSDDYAIKSGIKIESAYDINRDTYIYNMNKDTDMLIVVSDSKDINHKLLAGILSEIKCSDNTKIYYTSINYLEDKDETC